MKQKRNLCVTAIFCLFLGGMLLVSSILPDQKFSALENRYLAKQPQLSVKTFQNGAFMRDAESYVSDHIAGRDVWVSLKTWCERLSGKQENNGVYFAKQDTLIQRVDAPDTKKLEKDMEAIRLFAEHTEVPVYFGLIPSAAAIWSDRLPNGAPTAPEQEIINGLYAASGTTSIDLFGALMAHQNEDIYYHTDHHWSSLGAFYGANAILYAMGLAPLDLQDYEKKTVTHDFNGTTFSSSGVRWVQPDTIDTYISGEGVQVTNYFDGTPTEGTLYVPEYLEKKDKYSFFLGGNQPLCVIRTAHTDAPKVLIIRDSYADALAPMLTERFSEIHLFDLRYNMNSIQQYIAEQEIDQVLVLYSLNNFMSDTHIALLER